MRLNHLHLHVADVNRAATFYENYFGMQRHIWHGPILFLRDEGGLDLALAPGAQDRLPPWFHFGFRLPSADDVLALHARLLRDAGDTVTSLLNEPDLVSFRCRDPDGYLIEVYWE
jgi:catechol 2,3-dioxygenase-like lactoylglutathione lyase family enzyme